MQSTITEIISLWRAEHIELNPGVSRDLILLVEARINFAFPDEFTEMYLQINGFSNADWRTNMFSIWPLEKIMEEYEKNSDFIGFSDYLIHSHDIGFLKSKPGIYKRYGAEHIIYIAGSFLECIKMINSDSGMIY